MKQGRIFRRVVYASTLQRRRVDPEHTQSSGPPNDPCQAGNTNIQRAHLTKELQRSSPPRVHGELQVCSQSGDSGGDGVAILERCGRAAVVFVYMQRPVNSCAAQKDRCDPCEDTVWPKRSSLGCLLSHGMFYV